MNNWLTGWPNKRNVPIFSVGLILPDNGLTPLTPGWFPLYGGIPDVNFRKCQNKTKTLVHFAPFFPFLFLSLITFLRVFGFKDCTGVRPLRQEAEFCKIWLSEFEALADPMKFLGRSVVISVSDGIKKASTIWGFLRFGVLPQIKKKHKRIFLNKKIIYSGVPPYWKPFFLMAPNHTGIAWTWVPENASEERHGWSGETMIQEAIDCSSKISQHFEIT